MFKWVIDAGHSFNTPGKRTVDGSMKEYEFNRAVAAYCKEIVMNEYEGVEVYFSHSDSRDVPLSERANYSNKLGANCFTSIHGNAAGNGWNSANGIETFVYKTRPIEAYALALQVQRDLIEETKLADRGVKTADFAVLRETHMTSILIECGFMTNQKEAELLRSDEYRRKVAKAIVSGHAKFFGWKKKVVITPPIATNVIRYIYTGGYAGSALLNIHTYLIQTGHSFDCKRGPDGSIIFLIGAFDTGQANFKECSASIRKFDSNFKLFTREQAAEWR